MKWIVLSIVLSLGVYTYLTLHYRKTGRAYQPYADLKDRANTQRLLSAGFQRIALEAELPIDGGPPGPAVAATTAALPGLPSGLKSTLIDLPSLPTEIVSVTAAPSVNSLFAYPIGFKCTVADNKQQLAGASLYVRGEEIVITPDFEKLAGGLLVRTRESVIRVTVPPGALKPGHYDVTLVGAHASRRWTLQVN